jgi:hypothetical protein
MFAVGDVWVRVEREGSVVVPIGAVRRAATPSSTS